MTTKNFTEIDKERTQKEFGERLTQLRRQKNYSQEKLALESNIARSYLSGVERGKRNISLINIKYFSQYARSTCLDVTGKT